MHDKNGTPNFGSPIAMSSLEPAPGSGINPVVINMSQDNNKEERPKLADVITGWQVIISAALALLVLGGGATFFYLSFATDAEVADVKSDILSAVNTVNTTVTTHDTWSKGRVELRDAELEAMRRDNAAEIKEINAALKQIATDVAKMQGTLEARKK